MSEQSEKASQKPGKAPAATRAPRKARPPKAPPSGKGRKAAATKTRGEQSSAKTATGKAPSRNKAGSTAKADRSDGSANSTAAASKPAKGRAQSLAPDPKTVVFGSNRPIVAPPPPKPVSSGLRFSGPSDGVLKSSAPQATAPKAEGQTAAGAKPDEAGTKSTSARSETAAQKRPQNERPGPKAAADGKAGTQAKAGTTTTAKSKTSPAPETAKTGRGETESATAKSPVKPSGYTKPAIAPQTPGPRIEKTPARGPLALALAGLGIATLGLAWWLNSQPAPTAVAQKAPQADGDESAKPARPDTAGGSTSSASEQTSKTAAAAPALSTEELREIRDLLGAIGLDGGPATGAVSETLRAAIRDYQSMAGLPVDGEPSPALLAELRAVAALYGG